MGARGRNILVLLVWQFAKPVMWANLIALPFAWFFMHRWLDGFAYHVSLSPLLFLAAGLLGFVIALATVAGHALLVARAKPVQQTLGRAATILGIVVPTIEVVTGRAWNSHRDPCTSSLRQVVGIFATQATVRSQVYEIEIAKRRADLSVVMEPCPGLAGLIERGAPTREVAAVIDRYVSAMVRRIGGPPNKVILGSTHYEVVAELFRRALPAGTALAHSLPPQRTRWRHI